MTLAQKSIITSTLWIGALLAIISNVLFSALYMYGKWLTPLSGTDVFLWRMLMMWLCLMIFLLASRKIRIVIDDLMSIQGLAAWCLLLLPTPILPVSYGYLCMLL
ncbi:MAG: hypothetical protein ACTTG4_06050 [Moraxella sp.]